MGTSTPVSLLVEVKVMTVVQTTTRESSVGAKVRRLRLASLMTQRELAEAAGVSKEEVDLLEHGLPVPLDSRRKIYKELWSKKAKKR
jgi:DNA-binding XRE family transcriptional regulator